MKAKAFILIFTLILISSDIIIGRDPEVILDSHKTEALMSNKLIYYGLDLSKLRLINPSKVNQGPLIKYTYCPAWIKEFDEHFSQKRIAKMLTNETLSDKREPFQQEQYIKNNEKTIVNYLPFEFNIDSISLTVKDYHLEDQTGVGVSIIITELNKSKEIVKGYVTFFDIETRQLLYVVLVHGQADGMGMTSHWFEGMYEVWSHFYGDTYKNELKKLEN